MSWEGRCIVSLQLPSSLDCSSTYVFSFLSLHGFQRPSVNHVEGLKMGPRMCRQGLCSLKIGIEIRAGQEGVVGGAARSLEKRLAKESHRVQGFYQIKKNVEVEPKIPLHKASEISVLTTFRARQPARPGLMDLEHSLPPLFCFQAHSFRRRRGLAMSQMQD